MTRIIAILLLAVMSASANNSSNNNNVGMKIKNNKIKRPNKPVLSKSRDNTCYLSHSDYTRDDGVEVMAGDLPSLGKMHCKQITECGYGEIGAGEIQCDISGVNYRQHPRDPVARCGGADFDVGYLLGRDDHTVQRGLATFPSSCVCNSCNCNPCDDAVQTCKTTPNGYVCTGKQQKIVPF